MVLQQKSHHVTRSPLLLFLASRCSPKLLSRAFAWPFLACPLCPFLQTRPLPLYCLFNRIESLSSSIGLRPSSLECPVPYAVSATYFILPVLLQLWAGAHGFGGLSLPRL